MHTSTKNLVYGDSDLILSTDILAAIFQKNSHNSNYHIETRTIDVEFY